MLLNDVRYKRKGYAPRPLFDEFTASEEFQVEDEVVAKPKKPRKPRAKRVGTGRMIKGIRIVTVD